MLWRIISLAVRLEIAHGPQGILEVIQQSETYDEIEPAETRQRRVLGISDAKIDTRMTIARLGDVFGASICSLDL